MKPPRNNNATRDQLYHSNVGLIHYVAKRIEVPHWFCGNRDDVYQLAKEGLLYAAAYFDAGKGYRFGTYACRVMFNCIRRGMLRGALIPLNELRGVQISPQAARLRENALRWRYMDHNWGWAETSYEDEPLDEETEQAKDKRHKLLLWAIGGVRCRLIAWRYYSTGETLEQIGEDLGISKERVRQLVRRGEQELKKALTPYEEELVG